VTDNPGLFGIPSKRAFLFVLDKFRFAFFDSNTRGKGKERKGVCTCQSVQGCFTFVNSWGTLVGHHAIKERDWSISYYLRPCGSFHRDQSTRVYIADYLYSSSHLHITTHHHDISYHTTHQYHLPITERLNL
jgi:hypothetical protein